MIFFSISIFFGDTFYRLSNKFCTIECLNMRICTIHTVRSKSEYMYFCVLHIKFWNFIFFFECPGSLVLSVLDLLAWGSWVQFPPQILLCGTTPSTRLLSLINKYFLFRFNLLFLLNKLTAKVTLHFLNVLSFAFQNGIEFV